MLNKQNQNFDHENQPNQQKNQHNNPHNDLQNKNNNQTQNQAKNQTPNQTPNRINNQMQTTMQHSHLIAQSPLLFELQGIKRRIIFVTCFEIMAIACTSFGLAFMSGQNVENASVMGVASSLLAVIWNVVFNSLFERWESKQKVRGRSWKRRAAHALGFEGGLALSLVPLFAWWFEVSLWHALVMDFGLIVFFLIFTFSYNWLFDHLFGLPSSAKAIH